MPVSYLGPSLRRTGRRPSPGRRALAALALSLVLNLLLLTRVDMSWLSAVPATPRAVSMAALSAHDWEANRTVGAPEARRLPPAAELRRVPPPAPVPPSEPREFPGQLVRIAPPAKPPDQPPKDTKYIAEHDSVVEKETRARDARNEFTGNAPAPAAQPSQAAAGRPEARPDAAPERPRQEQAGRKPAAEQPRVAMLRPGTGAPRPEGADARGEPRAPGEVQLPAADRPAVPGEAGAPGMPGGTGNKLDLRPNPSLVAALAGGPAADHLPGVDEGEGTFLNARTWKYAGYFNRISEQLDIQWVREGREQVAARDPTYQRFMYKDRPAVVDVTLDSRGTVKQVHVVRSTGVDFLDRVAMEMFKKAEAFPNPPPGLVDSKGEINFALGMTFVGVSPTFGLFRRPATHD